ncbi:MAG: TonB-dependent receptor [Paludibacter sp.]|nr:TonB-dependent receptor [Paludibacter sp.]
MSIKIYALFLFLAIGLTAFAQNKQTQLTGKVKDGATGETLIGVSIQIEGSTDIVKTDNNGNFNLNTNKKLPFTVVVNYVGYQKQENIIESVDGEFVFEIRQSTNLLSKVVVTSRRRAETAQDIPIPISVISGGLVAESGAFNVNRVKELIPSVQLYSSNPRNTGINIRGLGSSFGLTNDGIDPGVGFYVDGVYYARPAATTLDFIDVEQIEVLRGPQGTLFGKNTTAGAFNVTTKKPSFTPGANFELSYGNYGYIQAKTSITGPLTKNLAARVSFSGTQRDGTIYNVAKQEYVNSLNNLGVRGQLLYKPNENTNITLIADATRQRPNGYAQVYAGTVTTLRSNYRQFSTITSALGYTLPSTNPFDRIIDQDTPAKSNQDLGGVSLNADFKLGSGTLTSTTAWRYWKWDPSTDRDFTELQALNLSQAPSKHNQWSQEIRWAGSLSSNLTAVFGVFVFAQDLKSDTVQTEEAGKDQWRFSSTDATAEASWKTPGLLDGYGIKTKSELNTFSGAAFGQVDWAITKRLHVLPGLRANYDRKKVDYKRTTYGGLQTSDAALLALKKSVYSNQSFNADKDNTNFSGQLTIAYKVSKSINAFATYASSYKPVGLNLGSLPTPAAGSTLSDLAVVKPEKVNHIEIGVKTTPTANSTLNLTVYNTDIKDYQTLVQSPELGVNRGYLANAEKVNVRGAELDGDIKVTKNLSFYGSLSYTDGKYVTFTNAPLPLEETGLKDANGKSVYFKDISGSVLPGISKWAGSIGGEYSIKGNLLGNSGNFFIASDVYARSSFSSSPSPSKYLNIAGYSLLNARIGFRATDGVSVTLWGRNILDKDYFEQLLPGAGNSGQYAGVLGDPRTVGVTIKYAF